MPGGYGIFGTPWGGGGTGAGASVAQTSGSGGGYGHDEGPGWGGSNEVADAVNTYQANPTPENQQNAVSAIAQQQYLAGPGGDLTAAQQTGIMTGTSSDELDASIQSEVAGITQNIQNQINAQNAAAAAEEAERIKLANQKKQGIFGTSLDYLSGMSFPGLTGILKGSQSTDRFFKKLASGKPLDPEDKIILANLIARNKENPNVFGDLSKYTTEDVDVEELGERLQDAVRPFEESEDYYKEIIESYLEGKPTGLDSLTSMMGDLTGSADKVWNVSEDDDWNITLEQLKKQITPEGMAYLKANDPKAYYSFIQPQTTGDLAHLAQMSLQDLGNSPEDRRLAARIVEAREVVSKGDQGGQGGGQGIADLSPVAQLAATTPEEVAAATVPAEVAATTPAATTTAAATEPTPFDYSQWPQFTSAYPGYNQYPWPNYVNQGLGQWPNFDYWNQIANAFPGMSQYG
jgi:hypothetical protein